jgi:hypothetical protein
MAQEQGLTISMEGGLDTTSSSFDLLKTPGAATRLVNFESSTEGGYRRVNGFRKFVVSEIISITVDDGGSGYATVPDVVISDPEGFGSGATATATLTDGVVTAITITNAGSGYQAPPLVEIVSSTGTGAEATAVLNSVTTPDGTSAKIQGIYAHQEGGLAIQDGNIYWSENGQDWIQVNKDYGTCSSGGSTTQYTCEVANHTWTADYATEAQLVSSGTVVALDSDARFTFTEYTPAAIDHPRVTICNGVDPVAYFETYVDGGTRYFKFQRALYKSFGISSPTAAEYAQIPRPLFCEQHSDHLIIGGWNVAPATFYYSDLYDELSFDGASAGEVNISDEVTGLKVFRNDLIVFGRNTIKKFVDINGTPSLQDVTKNIGCLDGFSIQEIGGDLVFLAPDGIRTVAATTRIDDIELSSISAKIQPIIRDLTSRIGTYQISSAVIRSKNQYRLFYTKDGANDTLQSGITGTLKFSSQGVPVWEWSELKAFPVACMTSGFDVNGVERLYHGNYNGYVYAHDAGNHLDGEKIEAIFKTPDIDYGDIGIRKTLHWIKLSVKPEGDTDISLDVRFDFDDSDVAQPQRFDVGQISGPSVFSDATFAVSLFGKSESPIRKINMWGSGFSNSFKFYTNDTNASYSIQGIYVSLLPASRR